jgi:S1-C subfamily serine protease
VFKKLTLLVCLAVFVGCSSSRTELAVVGEAANPMAATVRVDSAGSHGSGVVFKNGANTFVWTDAHVVEDCETLAWVADANTGERRLSAHYADVWVAQERIQDGRKVGEVKALARIVKFDASQDIALLMVRERGYGQKSVKFLDGVPAVGEEVWHVGNFLGPVGTNSVARGNLAAVGRLRRGGLGDETDSPYVYDQISCTGHPGSSGGGVFLAKTGECAGLVTEFLAAPAGYGFAHGSFCITPARRLREWAGDNAVKWAVDPALPVPDVMSSAVKVDPVRVPPPPAPEKAAPEKSDAEVAPAPPGE